MPETEDRTDAGGIAAILDATARLLDGRDFHRLTLVDIATEAGLSLADLHRHIDAKTDLVALFHRHFDEALWRAPAPDPEETPRDRLFDAIMRRFDAMLPYRPAIKRISQGLCRDPILLVCGLDGLLKTASLTLEVAGISATGPAGHVKTKALAGLYVRTISVWFADEEADMGKTMAALDRDLRRLERFATMIGIG